MRDPWSALGIPRGSDRKVVLAAYRRLAFSAHPDAGGDAMRFIALRAARDEALDRAPSVVHVAQPSAPQPDQESSSDRPAGARRAATGDDDEVLHYPGRRGI